MRYKLLGRTGLRVSHLCLGTMTFGVPDWGSTEEVSAQIYRRFREAGGNFFDAANEIYGGGRAEEMLGRLVDGERDAVVIGTKYTNYPADAGDPNLAGNHRKSMLRSLERSLRRFGTDHIDILWVHAWDFTTSPQEVMRALDDLVRQGKVLHVGVSNTPAWLIARCNTLAELRGWTEFAGVQIEYNLAERTAELETIPLADMLAISVLAWSPLAMGALTGKYLSASAEDRRLDVTNFRTIDPRTNNIAHPVVDLAARLNVRPATLALAWLLKRTKAIPVFGARTLQQLDDCIAAEGIEVEADIWEPLEAISAPSLLAPHNAIRGGRSIIYGGYADRIELPSNGRIGRKPEERI